MARTITWTESALRDVEQIAAYIECDSPQYATAFVARLFKTVEGIRLFPEAGAMLREYERNDLREVFIRSYRLIYRHTPDEVIVQAVIHGARDLPTTWRPSET
jgi:toxin ParE1/3/4